VTWCFGQPDVPWNDGREYLRAEEASQVGGNLARKRGALVVHGEQDTFYAQRRIQRAANPHQRVEQLGDAFERVVLALDRDEDSVTRDQSVQSEKVQCGRAVNDMNW